jgi:NAD(P)-dependent dehydrogenase (short-subunit alcohol dehydrogenase family)
MSKKVALVTGANRGLGKETAIQLAKKGYTVIVAGRKLDALNKVVAEIQSLGGDAVAREIDLEKNDEFQGIAQWVDAQYGRLDVLVNNAGMMSETSFQENTSLTVSMKALRETFETNFFGTIFFTQTLVPLLKKAGKANVVNVGSIMGSLGIQADPNGPLATFKPLAYDASKTALNAFTIHLAAALASDGIKVNTAHPGWVKTDLGTEYAPLTVDEGVTTILDLAIIGEDGPTGKFFHQGQELPW